MENRLHLYTPKLSELWYRKQILSDPDTMSYNKGYELNFAGYNNHTGCIDFPKSQWEGWYNWFINNEPDRFYAYIVRNDGEFIGEVNLHKSKQGDWYDMGVVIENKYRCNGYATEAIKLLLKQAFDIFGVNAVHNDFEINRKSAAQAHLSAGFIEYKEEKGVIKLVITREHYYHTK
ncbi:GNAT family N-acetyltransferase [Lachnoclostridium phytofermentans]|uniref:GCN5-related N-acetyltransferase n=1 Tax=Lachnoclostridium phytofermentans (strain ATCC 700394 / DSM 18823 / ISDg) TaxID=357809 RepID=A9KLZ1_LACP7|nr:GNAT family N-acetyltransferase [Lachnoclostridium phytofermentans]ABX41334.1 GCN5-related N-acetyltransferase [Lachnoclostridium phytofermentans ISDg]